MSSFGSLAPNPRMQRTPSAPLMRKPLGRGSSRALIVIALTVGCSRARGYVDQRLDTNTYFVQYISKAKVRDTEAERLEGRDLACHLASLTLSAGFDSYEVVPTDRRPDLLKREGETISMATIHMGKGLPAPDEHRLMDARLLRKNLCGGL